ncbi:hypothetical protein [Lentzea alba]|uniref:hypothetical protein n=1 Tax=Lentzea alba TaxID=2714351 RepID=UPI001A9454C6|nr:hypothetical protein [Lentzea alba]
MRRRAAERLRFLPAGARPRQDHGPSYLWNSATWEIREALLPHLRSVLTGDWDTSEIIRHAIEIREGTIVNLDILSLHHRSSEYPHARA